MPSYHHARVLSELAAAGRGCLKVRIIVAIEDFARSFRPSLHRAGCIFRTEKQGIEGRYR
ncbi:hypothetical protein [Neisseria gonorrhoeae]|uniref:hypothetical protein n=1 Tax=Neisseria gonorrhoeae TaxID=485 RepID=UPI002240D6BD|nr:hypothetical protein [Neisseria gonorrhoeae]UYP52445.1 hypothetical protein ND436_002650 [Neisseria gonorrhoeae]